MDATWPIEFFWHSVFIPASSIYSFWLHETALLMVLCHESIGWATSVLSPLPFSRSGDLSIVQNEAAIHLPFFQSIALYSMCIMVYTLEQPDADLVSTLHPPLSSIPELPFVHHFNCPFYSYSDTTHTHTHVHAHLHTHSEDNCIWKGMKAVNLLRLFSCLGIFMLQNIQTRLLFLITDPYCISINSYLSKLKWPYELEY